MPVADSKYSIDRIVSNPPGLFGEAFVIAVALKRSELDHEGECYVLTSRPAPELFVKRFRFHSGEVPCDLLDTTLDFIQGQARRLAEAHVMDTAAARAATDDRYRFGALSLQGLDLDEHPFIGCWLRDVLQAELRVVASRTQCPRLAAHLAAVSKLHSFDDLDR